MVCLETPRLLLREWRQEDLQDFYEYARVDGLGQMAGWPPHQSIETTQSVLNHFMSREEEYALVHKESGKVIGSLGYRHRSMEPDYPAPEHREIGYALSKDYWGQGLMPEAVQRVIRYAFEEDCAGVLWIGHFPTNAQSKRVIEKCGFQYYSQGTFEAKALGQVFDEIRYLLTREMYFAANQNR